LRAISINARQFRESAPAMNRHLRISPMRRSDYFAGHHG
jgi:hypothetical protein